MGGCGGRCGSEGRARAGGAVDGHDLHERELDGGRDTDGGAITGMETICSGRFWGCRRRRRPLFLSYGR